MMGSYEEEHFLCLVLEIECLGKVAGVGGVGGVGLKVTASDKQRSKSHSQDWQTLPIA
jgi:hypothetical protein